MSTWRYTCTRAQDPCACELLSKVTQNETGSQAAMVLWYYLSNAQVQPLNRVRHVTLCGCALSPEASEVSGHLWTRFTCLAHLWLNTVLTGADPGFLLSGESNFVYFGYITHLGKTTLFKFMGSYREIFVRCLIFNSPEPKAHWWAYRIGRPLLSIIRRPPSSIIFSSEATWPIEAKFHMEPPWVGLNIFCSNGPGHMTKMAAMPIYGKNLKILLLQNQKAYDLETW